MIVSGGSQPLHRGTTGHTRSPNHRPLAPVTIHTATVAATGSASCATSARRQSRRTSKVSAIASTASPGAAALAIVRPCFL